MAIWAGPNYPKKYILSMQSHRPNANSSSFGESQIIATDPFGGTVVPLTPLDPPMHPVCLEFGRPFQLSASLELAAVTSGASPDSSCTCCSASSVLTGFTVALWNTLTPPLSIPAPTFPRPTQSEAQISKGSAEHSDESGPVHHSGFVCTYLL